MPTLSVVVPATDSPPTLDRCLAAIAAAGGPPEEVVVVDHPPEVSAAGARNRGVARATGDVVIFVDADVEVHADVFDRFRAAFAARPCTTAVFGSYDDRPHASGVVSAFRNLLHHHVHQAGAGAAETFWTGLGAVRRTAFLDVGGFDESRYPHASIEDIELGDRLRAGGHAIVLDPTIQGTHLKRWTLRSMVWTDLARRGIPWAALQLRTRRATGSLNCGWRHRISAVAAVVAVAAPVLGAPVVALVALVALAALNHGFYRLLGRRLGPRGAALGFALHVLHHLVAVTAVGVALVAVPAGAALSRAGRRPRPSTAPPVGASR